MRLMLSPDDVKGRYGEGFAAGCERDSPLAIPVLDAGYNEAEDLVHLEDVVHVRRGLTAGCAG